MSKKTKHVLVLITVNVFFVLVCFFVLVPVLYAFSVSLNAENSLLGSDFSFLPKHMTLQNYKAVFTEKPVLLWLKNSLILAVTTLVISLGTGIPAAYAFSRKRFSGRKAILKLLILLYAFPSLLSMTALYKLLSPMGLINTRTGLVIVYTGTMAVFALWNMKGYFDTIPVEIEEAAMIDGCGPIRTFFLVVLPMLKPTLVSVGILETMWVWNDYLLPYLVLDRTKYMTIPIHIQYLKGSYGTVDLGATMAVIMLSILPIIIVYLFCQKYIIKGVAAGAVKG